MALGFQPLTPSVSTQIFPFMEVFLIDSWDEVKPDKQINLLTKPSPYHGVTFHLSNSPRQGVSLLGNLSLDCSSQTDCRLIGGSLFHLTAFVRQTIVTTGDNNLTYLNFNCFVVSIKIERIDWWKSTCLTIWEPDLPFIVLLRDVCFCGCVQIFPPFRVFPYFEIAQVQCVFEI